MASLARPGGNITGLTNVTIELAGKRVGLLKEMMPKVSRVAILWDEANPAADFNVKETEAMATAVGLTARLFGVRDPNEFSSAFSAMPLSGALASTSGHHHDRTKVERGLKVGQIGNAGVDLPPSFEQIGHPVLCLGDGR